MGPPGDHADPASYRERVFYEVWVRSCQDSDGDGIGDLRGATSRLDEIAALGIGGIWLMPTFPSPLVDSGYDISDFRGVHPDYGVLEDLDAFVAAAHKRNILVYLDMVFNHVSDQHPWFQSALLGPADPHFDYFRWSPDPSPDCAGEGIDPFGGEHWTLAPDVDLYYFHKFFAGQPDLNFRNPAVQDELLGVLDFWLSRGVDGFRFDAAANYVENGDQCESQPETIAFHERLREHVSGGIGKLERGFVTEVGGEVPTVRQYFGPSGDPMIFNFDLMFAFYTALGSGTPEAVASSVAERLDQLPAESRWGLVTGNHDYPRLAEMFRGDEQRLRLAAALQMTLPGVPFVWMGEELGLMAGTEVKVDTRDLWRAPYPWSAEAPGYGFTQAAEPFLAFAPGSGERAYASQIKASESLLRTYVRLISLRNATPALHDGGFHAVYQDDHLWAFERTHPGGDVLVVHNFARDVRLPLPAALAEHLYDELSATTIDAEDGIGPGETFVFKQ